MTMLLLAALPVLVALASGISLTAVFLHRYYSTQGQCRDLILNTQWRLSEHLRDLLRLNPEARRLRAKLVTAQRALKAALATAQPELIVLARAQLAVIRMEQLRLNRQQQGLLQTARRQIADLDERASQSLAGGRLTAARPPLGLAVRPEPVASITPDYLPMTNFRLLQRLEVIWSSDQLSGRCGASLMQRRRSFYPVLAGGKY